MARSIKLHDVVALLKDQPAHGLRRGQVGTIVELYKSGRFEVEFADSDGQTFAMATLSRSAILPLSYDLGRRAVRSKLVA